MNLSYYTRKLLIVFAILALFTGTVEYPVEAADSSPVTVTIKLGDYRFSPDRIKVVAGQPVRLVLTNTDGITPHNFTLKDPAGGLDLDVDIAAGKTREIEFVPQTPGSYPFFCNKKVVFLKSHRDRGMKGTLTVTAP